MIKELYRKYLGKPAVQQGIISQVIATTIIKILDSSAHIQSDYFNSICYISHLSHEDKVQLYLKKSMIIGAAQKKLLEDFGINAIIKDIRIGNR